MLTLPADQDRLNVAFRLAVGRDIKAAERASLGKLIAEQQAYYAANPAEAAKLAKAGDKPVDPKLPPVEVAAWTLVCSQMLNRDETLNK